MTSVVIVGSGFTGFECARRLSRQLRKHNASVDISIISPVDYMLYTPLLPDVAGGLVDARFVAIPLANTLRGVRAVRGRVDSVDFDGHTVTFTDPEEPIAQPAVGPAGADAGIGHPAVRHSRSRRVRARAEVDG